MFASSCPFMEASSGTNGPSNASLNRWGFLSVTAEKWCSVYETTLPQSSAPVFLIEHDQYFGRSALYQWDGEDYDDNAERFAFFSRACCQLVKAIHWSPDVIHAHDWQTALIPVYLKSWEADHPRLWSTASVQSIHNLGYQGVFPKDQIIHSQLGWEHFHTGSLEFYDQINYLKAGILFADKVSTVSPTYAHEIQTPEHGWALDGVLQSRSPDLVGILNGCEYGEWDPSRDSRIPVTFDVDQPGGKKVCKEELQRAFGLPIRPDVPIVGLVSRLAYQKGIDVLASAIPSMMSMDMQLVVLGAGEVWAHFYYGGLPSSYPGKVGSYIGYDDVRAHLIMAGSDFLLVQADTNPADSPSFKHSAMEHSPLFARPADSTTPSISTTNRPAEGMDSAFMISIPTPSPTPLAGESRPTSTARITSPPCATAPCASVSSGRPVPSSTNTSFVGRLNASGAITRPSRSLPRVKRRIARKTTREGLGRSRASPGRDDHQDAERSSENDRFVRNKIPRRRDLVFIN